MTTAPQTATEAKLRIMEEEAAAEEEYYNSPEFGAICAAERYAEDAWLRDAENNPEAGWEVEQNRFDSRFYN